jgi:hypothetical protein
MSTQFVFTLCCFLFFLGILVGAIGWEKIRKRVLNSYASATAEEKAICRQMERDYRNRMRDVKRHA